MDDSSIKIVYLQNNSTHPHIHFTLWNFILTIIRNHNIRIANTQEETTNIVHYPYKYIEPIWWADFIDYLRKPTVEWSDQIVQMINSKEYDTRLLGYRCLSMISMVKNADKIIKIFKAHELFNPIFKT